MCKINDNMTRLLQKYFKIIYYVLILLKNIARNYRL